VSRPKSKAHVSRPKSEEISRYYLDLLAQLPPKKPPAPAVHQRRKGIPQARANRVGSHD
jgi:hypothetical protein